MEITSEILQILLKFKLISAEHKRRYSDEPYQGMALSFLEFNHRGEQIRITYDDLQKIGSLYDGLTK